MEMTTAARTGSLLGKVVHESAPECRCNGLGVMLVSGRGLMSPAQRVVCSCSVGKFVAVMHRYGISVPAQWRR